MAALRSARSRCRRVDHLHRADPESELSALACWMYSSQHVPELRRFHRGDPTSGVLAPATLVVSALEEHARQRPSSPVDLRRQVEGSITRLCRAFPRRLPSDRARRPKPYAAACSNLGDELRLASANAIRALNAGALPRHFYNTRRRLDLGLPPPNCSTCSGSRLRYSAPRLRRPLKGNFAATPPSNREDDRGEAVAGAKPFQRRAAAEVSPEIADSARRPTASMISRRLHSAFASPRAGSSSSTICAAFRWQAGVFKMRWPSLGWVAIAKAISAGPVSRLHRVDGGEGAPARRRRHSPITWRADCAKHCCDPHTPCRPTAQHFARAAVRCPRLESPHDGARRPLVQCARGSCFRSLLHSLVSIPTAARPAWRRRTSNGRGAGIDYSHPRAQATRTVDGLRELMAGQGSPPRLPPGTSSALVLDEVRSLAGLHDSAAGELLAGEFSDHPFACSGRSRRTASRPRALQESAPAS